MPIANYTTKIDASQSVMEIQQMLVKHGATQFLINYGQEGSVEALSFQVKTPDGVLPFRLPVRPKAVQKVLEDQGVQASYRTYEHAVKVAWRIAKDWVRAQITLIEIEMVSIQEVFLPYMLVEKNQTLYEIMANRHFLLPKGSNPG